MTVPTFAVPAVVGNRLLAKTARLRADILTSGSTTRATLLGRTTRRRRRPTNSKRRMRIRGLGAAFLETTALAAGVVRFLTDAG